MKHDTAHVLCVAIRVSQLRKREREREGERERGRESDREVY